jgi:predicted nucleic acid-binding protein
VIGVGGAVLDASVVVKLVVTESDSDSAERVVGDLTESGSWIGAPDLLLAECANALWLRVRKGSLTSTDGETRLGLLRQISDGFDVWPLSALVFPAWRLATSLGITVYDACYVALAEAQGVPLVTADKRLVRSCAVLSGRVIPLASIA